MSTDSLIVNSDYNVKMDSNNILSLNSNEGTILPEDLSYAIIINSNEEISTSNDRLNTTASNCLILKLTVLIISSIIILLCIIFL
jgi:hypothetical protein